MPAVDIGKIMTKVRKYSLSADGKLRKKEYLDKCRSEGIDKTAAGGRIVTEQDMREAASKLIDALKSSARSCGLPASVMKHFDSLGYSEIQKLPDAGSVIYVYFGDDLRRDSLYPEGYDGVYNIVALLNNGYHARDYVYGSWDGHSPRGESVLDGRSTDTSAYIRSRKDREGLDFIGQAIRDFNASCSAQYGVTAVAGEDYKT